MRLAIFALASFGMTGCLHTFDARNEAVVKCAQNGQVFEGASYHEGSVGTSSYSSRLVRCRAPQSDQELCHVRAQQSYATDADMHDAKYRAKNVAVAFGYVFYILPGYGLYYVWSPENLESAQIVRSTHLSRIAVCDRSPTNAPVAPVAH